MKINLIKAGAFRDAAGRCSDWPPLRAKRDSPVIKGYLPGEFEETPMDALYVQDCYMISFEEFMTNG